MMSTENIKVIYFYGSPLYARQRGRNSIELLNRLRDGGRGVKDPSSALLFAPTNYTKDIFRAISADNYAGEKQRKKNRVP